MRSLLTGVLLMVPLLAHAGGDGEWEVIDNSDGLITSRRQVEGSSMLAFRGEWDTDLHVGRMLSVLADANLGPEWVDLQIVSREVEAIDTNNTIIYQVYDLSWPISDRDYVMKRQIILDPAKRVATVTYNSVEHASVPADDCCVRAQTYQTYWRLTDTDTGTHVEVEVHTNPKGSLPAWLVNMVQKGWPKNSITGLLNRAAKPDIKVHPEVASW